MSTTTKTTTTKTSTHRTAAAKKAAEKVTADLQAQAPAVAKVVTKQTARKPAATTTKAKAAPAKRAPAKDDRHLVGLVNARLATATSSPTTQHVTDLHTAITDALGAYAVPSLNILTGIGRPVLTEILRGAKGKGLEALTAWIGKRSAASAEITEMKVPGAFASWLKPQLTGAAAKTPSAQVLMKGRVVKAGRGEYVLATLPTGSGRTAFLTFLQNHANAALTSDASGAVKVAAGIALRRINEVG